MKFKYFVLPSILVYVLSGCGGGSGGGSTLSNTAGTTVQVVRGPILHATVKDSADQQADELGNGYYKFTNSVKYPIMASGGIIDINRDGKVDSGDVANDIELKTTSGTVLTITTTYDANKTTKTLVEQVANDLNVSLDILHKKTPLNSLAIEAISNILYKHAVDNNLSKNAFDVIKNEIYSEYNSYVNNTSHDSKTTEQELIKKLVNEKKVHELSSTEADNINQNSSTQTNSNSDSTRIGEGSNNSSNDGNHNGSSTGNDGDHDGDSTGGDSTGSGLTGGGGTTTSNSGYTLLAWNDLGMHCMDGRDFSVFSILPPYNNLHAQLIKKDGTSNKHIVSGITITYSSAPSLSGKYNTTSMYDNNNNLKTNFWSYVSKLFNTTLPNDTGLTGNTTPSKIEKPLKYNKANNWWEATGLPLTPYNDDGSKNYYPMVYVTAKDSSGKVLATTQVVLPISDEMDCKACHSSTSGYTAAKPNSGWVNDSDPEKDFKLNILLLHDQKFPTAVSDNQTALKKAGYNNYDNAGLYVTATTGNPILCATCHKSNALPGTGISGIKPLTEAIHSLHSKVTDPTNGKLLSASTNRSACYRCHPGATTQCLRGEMGKQSNIQCQSCHGNMNAVGKHGRIGWLDEPNCQSCHQNGKRYITAVTDINNGTLRSVLDTRFATNPNTPQNGVSMYRFSTGHGKMQCEACHGSTHAIYPSSHKEDNLQSIAVQGHEGTIAECTSCHTTIPNTINGGPHGMHTVGQSWVHNHGDVAEHGRSSSCTACHGTNYKGSPLSKTFSARSFSTKWGTKNFSAGHQVSCYDCHNGPNGG